MSPLVLFDRRERQPLLLALLFFVFCYALLTWRSLMLSDAAELFSLRRLLILGVGGAVFWLAVHRLGRVVRPSFARVASWIVGGTLVVLVARLLFDALFPAEWITGSYALRWTLAWSGYFGLWLMGTLAFRRWDQGAALPAPAAVPAAAPAPAAEEVEWLIDALLPELEGLAERDRSIIVERLVRRAGGYEIADPAEPGAQAQNARLRLARRLAARLAA